MDNLLPSYSDRSFDSNVHDVPCKCINIVYMNKEEGERNLRGIKLNFKKLGVIVGA